MISLLIQHITRYRFNSPVRFGPHRLMLRPRESRELQVMSSVIKVTPPADLSWAHDVFGNAVATASFHAGGTLLVIESETRIQLSASPWPEFDIAASAVAFPFRYSDAEWSDLGALAMPQYADPQGRLRAWAQGFVAGMPTHTLALLKDLSEGVSRSVNYQARDADGTQAPLETLDRGWGSCRDFAVLFVEAARTLGFGARLVSGYLYNPLGSMQGSAGGGSTHAWAEIYVPGAGWIAFDPTNRSIGGQNLIPVAVVRDLREAAPVSGTYWGDNGAYRDLTVEVRVTA